MRTLAALTTATVLVLAGCGGDDGDPTSSSGSMGTLSMESLTDENADQACATLFGDVNDLGRHFSEADYTWEGSQTGHKFLNCSVTVVGTTINDAPLSFTLQWVPGSPQNTTIQASSDGKALPDDLKAKVAKLVEGAKSRVVA